MKPGQTIGAYVIEAPVGQGGMGAVYRARDTKLGRPVALKVMLPEETADEDSVARFLREGKLAAALEHPGIVRVYEVGTHEGSPFIAMEWIAGRTMRGSPVGEARVLLREVAEILAFAHERGVIHRDLKPANVMLDSHGRPKLVDFGIAKRVASATFATRDGMVLGTPSYMAPEQELSSAVDARADQYAWGVMAYELFTGEKPSRPALSHAELDEKDAAVIMRALSPSPADRFPSMRDLVAAWSAKPLPPPPPAKEPKTRVFFLSLLGAMTAAAIAAGALVHLSSPKTVMPPPSASAPVSVPVTAPEPSATESAEPESSSSTPPETSAPIASVAPTARGPRLVQSVTIVTHAMLNIGPEGINATLNGATIAALKRCFVGVVAYRAIDPKFTMRIWLKSDGTVDSTSAINPQSNPESWPGPKARGCVHGVIMPLKFKVSDEGSFLLDFQTK